ncbi:MAG: HigA family addiction module antitoxin [Rickettsiales bacterium]|nr:HigA family addiction module antitoxin [Rickettsiales bacterium]
MKKLKPIHPGDILFYEFMKPLKISQNKLARDIDVPPARINAILKHTRSVTADTALRLARYFNTSPEFWVNMQSHYDLRVAQNEYSKEIEKSVRLNAAIFSPSFS